MKFLTLVCAAREGAVSRVGGVMPS